MKGDEQRYCDYEACVRRGDPLPAGCRADMRKHAECRRLASKAKQSGLRTHLTGPELMAALGKVRRSATGPAAAMRARARARAT